MDDLGKSKAAVLADRCCLTAKEKFMDKSVFGNYDVIFCCVDNMMFRKDLYQYSWVNGAPFWIDGRCTSRQGAVFNSTMDKEQLKTYLNDSKESTGCLLDHEKEKNISHALPIIVSGMMLQVFLNWYRGMDKLPQHIFVI
jgi:hypothetical protein